MITQAEKIAFRQTQRWKNFRETLKILRNCTCELCGIVKRTGREQAKLNVHHLNPDQYTDVSNIDDFALLCYTCHEIVEYWVRRINSKKFSAPPNFATWFALLGDLLSYPAKRRAEELLGIKGVNKEMKDFGNSDNQKKYEEPPIKTYPARLVGIFDVGTHKKYNSQEWETNRSIVLRFELLGDAKTSEGENFVKDKIFKWTNHTKSGLITVFQALGMPVYPVKNETELGGWYEIPKGYDYKKHLGAPCIVSIVPKQQKEGAKIGTISQIVEGMKVPEATSPLIYLDWDDKNFITVLEGCPKYIQSMVMNSKEVSAPIAFEDDTIE